jgi:PhoH-like ATPase
LAIKSFILDTNVLIHNPAALTAFADNEVVLPFTVLEELDEFKKDSSEIGRNVRHVVRIIDRLRRGGRLSEGVPLNSHGTLRVDLEDSLFDHPSLVDDTADNRIISCALRLKAAGKEVIFVSKDINARIKSDALGIKTMDFEKQKVDFERLYAGYRELKLPADEVARFSRDRSLIPAEKKPFDANEFAILTPDDGAGQPVLARFDRASGKLVPTLYTEMAAMGVRPRNIQQKMVFELLLNDDIKMVTLLGQAGTGKTLLAVACGLQQVLHNETYKKLLVSRPIMPLGNDIGYLPGSKEEKLSHWMQPIFDNLAFILSLNRKSSAENVEKQIDDLRARDVIELEALAYIRGRSIPGQYMIIDEAQNLTPHEVKTIATRVGEGTKLIFTGDATQIDNPYLDSGSNGLSYAVEQMRGLDMVGHVTLCTSERSELASLASERL